MGALDLSVVRPVSTIATGGKLERFLVFDTETTGLGSGHRIVEIGVVEIVNRRVTGREFHVYINPERSVDADAQAVHGLSSRFLADKPKFGEIVQEFIDFMGEDAELVAHNATFDINMLNAEFERIGSTFRIDEKFTIIDTMKLARTKNPGQRATMDALCDRYGVSRHERQVRGLHGALIDSRILARLFIQMTAGQVQLGYSEGRHAIAAAGIKIDRSKYSNLKIVYASDEEQASHARLLDAIEKASGGYCAFRGKWTKPEKETAKMDTAPKAAEFGSGTVASQADQAPKSKISHLVMTASVGSSEPETKSTPDETKKADNAGAPAAAEVEFSPSI